MSRVLAKAKIVRIIARLNIGGPAIQAIMLTRDLQNAEFDSFLVSGKICEKEGDMMPYALEMNVKPIVFSELGREISGVNDVVTFFKLVKFLKRVKPQIVHTHTAKAGTLGRLAAWVAGVPVRLHTFHGHVLSGYFSAWKTNVFIFVERFLALLTDRIVVLGEEQRKELVEKYQIGPATKFTVVPLGFDLNPFLSVPNEKYGNQGMQPDSSPFILGFIGRLVNIKNPFLLLHALDLLDLHDVTVGTMQLWIVGRGPLEDALKSDSQAKERGVVVRFLGWQRDMPQLYSSLDIVILTSLNEGTPVALIEAMASGKAFIATEVGGVRDLMVGRGEGFHGRNGGKFTVYENGILIASQDVHALADALEFLASHQHIRKAMGTIGRKFVKVHFTKERLLKDIQFLYKNLLIEKGFQFSSRSLGESEKS